MSKVRAPEAAAKRAAVKCPTKRSVNLAKREPRTRSAATLAVGLALIAALALAVAKFAVLDQLARQRAAEQNYQTVHAQYVQMQQALEDYPAVEQEYRTYARSWMTAAGGRFVSVDRMDVLALLEQQLMPYGEIQSFVVHEDTVVVSMSGMSLAEISAMFEKLQKQPIVAGAVLNLASTAKDAAQLDFSITILLQSAEEDGT